MKINKEAEETIVKDYNSGLSVGAVAEKNSVSWKCVRRVLKSTGINIEKRFYKLKLDEAAIVAEFQAGTPAIHIAAKYNVYRSAIKKILDRAGIKTDREIQVSDEQIVTDYKNGYSMTALGKKYNCSGSAISDHLRANGIIPARKPFKIDNITGAQLVEDYKKKGVSYKDITAKYGIHDRESIMKTIRRFGGVPKPQGMVSKYECDENFFSVIDTEEKAYWLGMLITDGFVLSPQYLKNGVCREKAAVGLSLAVKDKEHLIKFRTVVKSDAPLSYREPKINIINGKPAHSTGCFGIRIKCQKMVEDLAKYGVVPNKTSICYYPGNNLIPTHLERHFWRGCIDGDGSVGFTGGHWFIFLCGHINLVSPFRDYCKVNLDWTKNKFPDLYGDKKTVAWFKTFNVRCKPAEECIRLLYKDSMVYLNRKYVKVSQLLT